MYSFGLPATVEKPSKPLVTSSTASDRTNPLNPANVGGETMPLADIELPGTFVDSCQVYVFVYLRY